MSAIHWALRVALLAPFMIGARELPSVAAFRSGDPPAATDALDELVASIGRRAIDEHGVPGLTIAVAKDGEILSCRGFGYADAGRASPAMPNTRWPIGSFAHSITALAVLQLVEARKLALDDDIAKLLPNFPVKQHVLKLEHLLANTSGVPGWRKLQAKHPEVTTRELSSKDLLAIYADVPFDFEPGSAYSLDTTGYVLLGLILAGTTGEPLVEHVKKQVIAPIGMANTDVCPVDARPSGYADDCKQILDDRDLEVPLPASPYSSDQALCSTAGDLALWMHAVYDRKAFGGDAAKYLSTSAHIAGGVATGASFAMLVGTLGDSAWYAHDGGVGGFRLRVVHYARIHTTVVVLANCASAPVEEFEHEIACHVLGIPAPSHRGVTLSAADAAACVGTYQIATTRVRITSNDGKLFYERAVGAPVELRCSGPLTFVLVGESDARLVFHVEGGKAEWFELTRAGLVSTGRRMD